MNQQEFTKGLSDLQGIIHEGVGCLAAWRGLMVEDDESAAALNRYRGLFLTARIALREWALLQLAKVFDRDSRTSSLMTLLRAAKEDRENLAPHTTEIDLLDIERRLDAHEDLLGRLKDHRDQRLAHHDTIRTPAGATIRLGEVEGLIDDVISMYNVLEQGQVSFKFSIEQVRRDAGHVVRLMREDLERARRTIAETETEAEAQGEADTAA